MRKSMLILLLMGAITALAAAQTNPPAPAQTPDNSTANSPQQSIKVNVNLVNVLATVTDKKGHMVLDLTKDDFRIYEDKQPQSVLFFSRETDLPLRIGILIDTSNSVRERLRFEQEAAVDFLNEAVKPGRDQALVIGFDVQPQLVQDYTDEVDKLAGAIRGLEAGGTTALYDAIYYACKQRMLVMPSVEPYLRRVLIIVSDGRDNESEHTREEALAMAQRSEAVIYAISTNNSGSDATEDKKNGPGTTGDRTLKRLAEETGGRVFYPFEARDLASNFQDIARELRSQYSLAYRSTNQAKDGSFRVIAVETTNKNDRARAKTGYFAPTQ